MSEAVCRGCWELSNNCTVCRRCKETEAAYLRGQLADAAQKAGEFAHQAQTEIATLKALVAHMQQALGIVTVRSTSGLTETVCQTHLLPRHHQMLLDECERLRNDLHQAREQIRRQG